MNLATTNLFPLPYWAPALQRVPTPLLVLNEAFTKGERARKSLLAARDRLGSRFSSCGKFASTPSLAAEQLFLLIDIFLRGVARRDQRVHAGLGQLGTVLLEADIEKVAADGVLGAEIVVVPLAVLLHCRRHGHGLGERRAGETKDHGKSNR
jgi:hypothetical protein